MLDETACMVYDASCNKALPSIVSIDSTRCIAV